MRELSYINYKALIAKHIFPDVVRNDDGYYVWWPTSIRGCYSEGDVEMIGLLLKEANRRWDNELRDYFATLPKEDVRAHVVDEIETPWGKLPVIEF